MIKWKRKAYLCVNTVYTRNGLWVCVLIEEIPIFLNIGFMVSNSGTTKKTFWLLRNQQTLWMHKFGSVSWISLVNQSCIQELTLGLASGQKLCASSTLMDPVFSSEGTLYMVLCVCLFVCLQNMPSEWCKVSAVQTSPFTAIVYSLHVLQLLYSCWIVWSWDTLWLPQNLVINW